MFKKSWKSGEFDIFTSSKFLLSGNSLKMYEDEKCWHNRFRNQVAMQIDENIFWPSYCGNNGASNASVRVLVALMIQIKAEGLCDHTIFENCSFNRLVRGIISCCSATQEVFPEKIETTHAEYMIKSFLIAILPKNLSSSENICFSIS